MDRFTFLVPKLRLGTRFLKLRFTFEHETEFRTWRSQTEFGNEMASTYFLSFSLARKATRARISGRSRTSLSGMSMRTRADTLALLRLASGHSRETTPWYTFSGNASVRT